VILILVVTGIASGVLRRTVDDQLASSFHWRTEAWTAAYKMFRQRPLMGWGLGSFALFGDRFGAPSFSTAVRAGLPPSLGETAHNQYVQMLAEMGLIGLLL